MVLGLVSSMASSNEMTAMRTKKVSDNRIIEIGNVDTLVSSMKSGDVVYLLDVQVFTSVHMLYKFMCIAVDGDVSVKFINQSYLDVGNGKHWRSSIINQLKSMMVLEERTARVMQNELRVKNTDAGIYIGKSIGILGIRAVASVYASDGILKRGK